MSAVLPVTPIVTKPRLSARNAAKFMHMGWQEQWRLLHDQKFPKQTPQVFKQPYYAPPINGIRAFLEHGPSALPGARAQIQSIKVASRRMHCLRVLEQFIQSDHAARGLKPMSFGKVTLEMVGGVELRLSPDLCAMEGGEERIIFFNANVTPQDVELAKATLDIAHWLLEENELEFKPEQIEFIDLSTGVLHKIKKRRARTIKDLEECAKIIGSLWPTIDP